MMLGLGQDTSSGPIDLSQTPIIPSGSQTGLIVPGANPGELQVSVTNVGPQTPVNTLTGSELAQFVAQYGGLPQTGQPLPSTRIPTWAIIALVAGFGLFVMASSGGRRR